MFAAFDADADGRISVVELLLLMQKLTSGHVDEDTLRAHLSLPAEAGGGVGGGGGGGGGSGGGSGGGGGGRGLTFERFRQLVSEEDLFMKTTIRV
eukprot:COSAG01_NODE_617_length_14808_cov_8.352437_13_plen_95_part_00